MNLILGIILAVVLVPILFIGAMSLFGVAIKHKGAWGISIAIGLAVVLFAGFTTW